jgi:hypothetical protein
VHAKRSWVALAAALVALAFTSMPASAQTTLASCPGPTGGDGEPYGSVGAGREQAQTFSLGGDAIVEAAQLQLLRISSPTTGDFVVRLFTADGTGPTGSPLASGTVPFFAAPPVTSPSGTFTISLSPPTLASAGQLYAIAVSITGEGQGAVRLLNNNPCPGQRFVRSSSSGAWGADPTTDFAPLAILGSPPPAPPDSNAPNVTITGGPKDKTKKKTATFVFTGTDTRAISGFQCSLDGEAFRACSSPMTYKVKKGKHTFQVQAIDQAGNVGSPATDTWKVKKKRKR